MFDRKAQEAVVDLAPFSTLVSSLVIAYLDYDIDIKPGLTAIGPCMHSRAVLVAAKVLLAW